MDLEGYSEYVLAFMAKLSDVVDGALLLNNPMLAQLQASSFFPPKVQAEAASVGFEMNLPHEAAIAFLIIAEATRVEKSTNISSRLFSSSARKKYNAFLKMTKYVDYAFQPYRDSQIPRNFINRVNEGLSA